MVAMPSNTTTGAAVVRLVVLNADVSMTASGVDTELVGIVRETQAKLHNLQGQGALEANIYDSPSPSVSIDFSVEPPAQRMSCPSTMWMGQLNAP